MKTITTGLFYFKLFLYLSVENQAHMVVATDLLTDLLLKYLFVEN